jgi:hypothetical protein
LVEKGYLDKYEDEKHPDSPYYVPRSAPFVREYELSKYLKRVRDYSVQKEWFFDRDIGFLSPVRVGFYGIPEPKWMTNLELDMLGNLGVQLREVFANYDDLCSSIAFRRRKEVLFLTLSDYGDLSWNYLFDLMVGHGKSVLQSYDAIGIEALSSIVPEFLDFMDKMHEKYGSVKGRHEIKENALDEARRILEMPSAYDIDGEETPPTFDSESFDSRLTAIVATRSPRTLDEYASHPENCLKEWWTNSSGQEFPAEEVRRMVDLEAKGIDIYELQEKEKKIKEDEKWSGIGRICLGLEDLARKFTCLPESKRKGMLIFKIELTEDAIQRLEKWDWLLERIGEEGIRRFVRLVKLQDKIALRDWYIDGRLE